MDTRKKRTRRRGSKKGTPFEREMARTFSLWFSHGENDNLLWRTSQSGGRSTTRAKAGKDGRVHCSDLCSIDPISEPLTRLMIIELKKGYNKKTIHDLLDKPGEVLQEHEQWFVKAECDRIRAGAAYWLLVHQRDYRKPIAFFPTRFCTAFDCASASILFDCPALEFTYQNGADIESVSAVRLETFLATIDPSDIVNLARDYQAGRLKDVT